MRSKKLLYDHGFARQERIHQFIDVRKDRNVIPYWVNVGSNAVIQELLQHHAFAVQEEIETLLEGGYIEKHINENIVFPELKVGESLRKAAKMVVAKAKKAHE